ncbi:MAG TPA: hypothetical protein VFU59_05710 [Candidatus Eisenbacteria bacterium]|nr:hypothetical protein [Candidatus Eisenbacteria bacterium]
MGNPIRIDQLKTDPEAHLSQFQGLMSLARETLPALSADATRKVLAAAAGSLGLELVENKGVAPIFALLPPAGAAPRVTLFATWHTETVPVMPAAVEGSERLGLAATIAGLSAVVAAGALEAGAAAVVVTPGAAHGSLVLDPFLRERRARIAAPLGFWIRVIPKAPKRRRIFLGGRGRVVIGIWGGDTSPHLIRDEIVATLSDEAYGPRPLDFELIRKLADSRDVLEFLEETVEDPEAASGTPEGRLKFALFEPHGQVIRPGASHPDRPAAWLTIETAEGMEGPEILARIRAAAPASRVEMAESMPWDRIGIHHPAVQTLIPLSKSRSAGPEIWPSSPWATPSGVFTRALGMPLAEWGVPLPAGNAVRFPKPESFDAMAREVAELLLRAVESLEESPTS